MSDDFSPVATVASYSAHTQGETSIWVRRRLKRSYCITNSERITLFKYITHVCMFYVNLP